MLDTGDFAPFNNYYKLSTENIESAYKEYYHSPRISSDVLASDSGRSCTYFVQMKGKKVYLARFVEHASDRPGSIGKRGRALDRHINFLFQFLQQKKSIKYIKICEFRFD